MNKSVATFVGLGLFSLQAQAMVVETITGETFAGYADSFISTNSVLGTDLGNSVDGSDWRFDLPTNAAVITDLSAGTSTLGVSDLSAGTSTLGGGPGANYIDLGFDADLVNGDGNDLKLFFVGGKRHNFDVTIGNITKHYDLGILDGDTGSDDLAYGDPILAQAIDLDSFVGLTGDSFSQIRLTIGDGYTLDSAVPSFVGAYNVVPVPAAVWLFGSGLLGLMGVARRRHK